MPVVSTRWFSWLEMPISTTPRTRACRFSSARPVSSSALEEGVDHRRDGHDAVVEAGPARRAPRRRPGSARRGVAARHRHTDHVLGADRVAGDRGHQRRVDAAGQPEDHRPEAVLADVVAQAEDDGPVDLLAGVERLAERSRTSAGTTGRASPDSTTCRTPSTAGGAWCAASGGRSRSTTSSSSSNCGRAGEHCAVGGHDDRVAVEDQVVLPADHVDVGERAAGLGGPTRDQLAADVVLVALVRRAVDRRAGARRRRGG